MASRTASSTIRRECRFDPGVLLCKGDDGPSCLTAPQVTAAKKIYSPAINPRTGKRAVLVAGAGNRTGLGRAGAGREPSANIYDQYRYVVFKDPELGLEDVRLRQGRRARRPAGKPRS